MEWRKSLAEDEKGMTLIEVVITLAVVGLIIPVLAALSFQATFLPLQAEADITAFSDLELTSGWLSTDLAGGAMGNNLGLSPSSPPWASVSIGASPGYPGNNSLTIAYNSWATPGSTTTERHTITYALEDDDPGDPTDIQMVRRDDAGSRVEVAKHIADPAHITFSGSAQSSKAGGVSPGLTLDITSTYLGATDQVVRSAALYVQPRSYQPPTPPAPSLNTWNVDVPYYLPGNTGYWYVLESQGSGTISAAWSLTSLAAIQVWIYSGQPLGLPSGDSIIAPNKVVAPVVISNSATTNNLTVSSADARPAGKYMVYFYNASSNYINTSAATITYMSPAPE